MSIFPILQGRSHHEGECQEELFKEEEADQFLKEDENERRAQHHKEETGQGARVITRKGEAIASPFYKR